jgi:hypothetical protein
MRTGAKKKFEETMTKNFPKLQGKHQSIDSRNKQTISRINTKKITCSHSKLLETEAKEKS